MPKPVAEVGEGHEGASGNGVYCFIRDLIVEGRDARFVDKKGRYVINWSRALKCYHDYKSKRNPQYKSKNISRRKASNGLRAALLNFYKKEGAKEYKDSKKVNENDEVVERQFQMPPRVFESLFGSDVQLPDDSSEHETSSITSEGDEKPLATPNSSDTGFDEAMDISDDLFNTNEEPSSHCALGGLPAGDPVCSNVKTEEDQVDPSDITGPCQMFDISEEELDLVLGEICSNSDTNDIDTLGVVRDICPSSGSVKGGMQFYISLTEELSEDDKSGIAHFDGIGDVYLERLNCYTLAGTIPASQQPGPVSVTVNTQDDRLLGMTYFMYVDEIQEVLKQIVKDPALQALYLTMWSQEHGFFGSDSNLDPSTLQDQGSSVQGTHAQALKGLQLLVYTAAQTNAQQFIQMIFSTSAGRLVFNAYKDRPQLPEDVARANGHDDLAQYLQDVNARLTKENSINAQPSSIDWLELIEAVNKIQKQSSVIEDETDLEIGQSKDDDDQSDYFADVETSSCGSFELEIGWSDSEDGEGPCSKGGGLVKEPDVKSASMNVTPCYASLGVGTRSGDCLDLEDGKNSEEGEVKEVCNIGCFDATQKIPPTEREQEARACLDQEKCMQLKNERPKKEPDERLTPCMEVTSSEELTGFGTSLDKKIDQKADGKNVRKLVTTEVGKSSLISQLSKKVAASGREEEASTVPSQENTTKPKRTTKWLKGDAITTSSQQGACLNETQEFPSFREQIFQRVTGGGTQNRENINEKKEDSTTGPSQAERHKRRTQWRPFGTTLWERFVLLIIVFIIVLCLVAGIQLREGQLLHWAVPNGHIRISQALLKFVSGVETPNFRGDTPLHPAAKTGYKDLAELLIKLGSNVNFKDYQQQTPLHLAAWCGCLANAKVLIQSGSDVNGSDVNVRNKFGLTPLGGHKQIIEEFLHNTIDVNARDGLHQIAALSKPLLRYKSNANTRDIFGQTSLHLALPNGDKNVTEVLCEVSYGVRFKAMFGDTLHLDAWSGHQELTEFLLRHGSGGQAIDDHLANNDVNVLYKGRQSPLHLTSENDYKHICDVSTHNGSDVNTKDNSGKTPLHLVTINQHESLADILGKQHWRLLKTSDLLRQTRYKFDPRDAPVICTCSFLEYLKSGRSLKELLEAEVCHPLKNNEMDFPQTSCEPVHQETQSCLASVNLSIGLGDDLSGPRYHKLILDKPLITKFLNISLGGGDAGITGNINPVPVIKYQGSRSRYTRIIYHSSCLLHSTKFGTNGRPKDRDYNDAKYSHSFGFVGIGIKNGTGTSKVLIRIELPLTKEIVYEGHHFVNAAVLLLLILLLLIGLLTFKYVLPDMGNDSKKPKSSKVSVAAVAGSKAADKTKHVLILYKPWSERACEIMNYLYDALNQVEPAGCVEISSNNAIDLSEHNYEYVRNRTSQWLMYANNVVLLCITANQAEQLPRKAFIDDSGKLPSKMFPVVFGTETPSQWPECYSLGLADPENVQQGNAFETEGLDTLVAAIKKTVE